jgi:hypothetical protein
METSKAGANMGRLTLQKRQPRRHRPDPVVHLALSPSMLVWCSKAHRQVPEILVLDVGAADRDRRSGRPKRIHGTSSLYTALAAQISACQLAHRPFNAQSYYFTSHITTPNE